MKAKVREQNRRRQRRITRRLEHVVPADVSPWYPETRPRPFLCDLVGSRLADDRRVGARFGRVRRPVAPIEDGGHPVNEGPGRQAERR